MDGEGNSMAKAMDHRHQQSIQSKRGFYRSRRALMMTLNEESAIAKAAIIGESIRPQKG